MALLDLQAMELPEEISGRPKGSRASKHCGGGGGGGGGGNVSTLSLLLCAR
jgi:hypothetical protein